MNKFLSIVVSTLLFSQPLLYGAAAVKQQKSGKDKQATSKPKNLDRVYGEQGVLNESKKALVSVDPLALQSYSEATDNFDIENYDKVTLKSAILEALSQSNKLKSAHEKVVQIELELKTAYSGYLPTLDFEYSHKQTHNYTGDPDIDTASHSNFDDEQYKFTLKQSLYAGGATLQKVKSLQSKVEEGKRKFLIVLEQEIQNAIKAYFEVLFNYQQVRINEKNMEKLNKILDITQVKYDSGALAIGDLSAVKANIANASSNLITIKSKLADALDYYIYIIGEDFKRTAPFEEDFNIQLSSVEELYKEIELNNYSLLNYRLNIQSVKDNLLSVKAAFKPKLDMELGYKNVLDKEDFEVNEESYSAKVTLTYNIYNGGKDTINTMKVFSDLQELKYRYAEEIKKIKWEAIKLFNSINSLDETIKSTKEEVEASNEMVGAYWEGFQLGEQDLQVLLQGQRQLNAAELNLVKFKQDYLTNMFKLLSQKGALSSYFNIDPENPHFIDFSNTDSVSNTANLDLSVLNDANKTIQKDINKSIDEYLDTPKMASFDDVISFRDKFLQSDDEKYTLQISDFNTHFEAYEYLKRNRLLENGFSYRYFNKEGELVSKKDINKIVSTLSKIAYGVFNTQEDANNAINSIFELKNDKNFKVVQIKTIKDEYRRYLAGLETTIEPYIVKPKIKKTFITNQEFKKKFLEAPEYFFSINIVSVENLAQAQKIVRKEKIENETFSFRYGKNGEWVKIMFGVFPTYTQAFNALANHQDLVDEYQPVIEKIVHKQELYNKYKQYNGLPQWYLDEQKEKALEDKSTLENKISIVTDVNTSLEKIVKDTNETKIIIDNNITQLDDVNNTITELNTTKNTTSNDENKSVIVEELLDTNNSEIVVDNNQTNPIEIPSPLQEQENNVTQIKNDTNLSVIKETSTNNLSFEEQIKEAKGDQYTITLMKSYPQRVEQFLTKNLADRSDYLIKTTNGVSQLIVGLYNDKKVALEELSKLNKTVKKDAFLTKVSSFRKKHSIEKNNIEQHKAVEKSEIIDIKENQIESIAVDTTNILETNTSIIEENNVTVLPLESNNTDIKSISDHNNTTHETNLTLTEVNTSYEDNNSKVKFIEEESFEEKIKNANSDQYTITLIKSYPPKVDTFIQKNSLTPENYLVKTSNGVSQLIYGIYENKPQAQEQLDTLEKSFKKDAFLTKISSFRKKHTMENNENKSIEVPTVEKAILDIYQYDKKSNFKDLFIQTPDETYTILLAQTNKSKVDNFVKSYILDDQYIVLKDKVTDRYNINYGLYLKYEDALQAAKNVHPKLLNKVTINQIKEFK